MPLSRITSPFMSATANVYSPSANTVTIRTASTDRFTINPNGNVLIGNTATSRAGFSPVTVFASNVGPVNLELTGRAEVGGGAFARFIGWEEVRNSRITQIDYERTGDNTGHITFYANNGTLLTEALRVTSNGVSTAGHIRFPTIQNVSTDPNTLDDYEEGTWTPVDSSGAGLSFSTAAGSYVKIGRMVLVQFTFTYPSTSNGAIATIGGLPFIIDNSVGSIDNGGTASGLGYQSAGSAIFQIHTRVGFQTFGLYNITTSQTNANCSGINFRGGIVYRAST
jgi:hypothetical protein